MKLTIKKIFLLLIVTSTTCIWAGELEDGLTAFEKKDYKTA